MANVTRTVALLSLLALGAGSTAMIACGGASESETSQPSPGTETVTPQPVETTNPETGLKVKAIIASASLGDSSANVQIAFFASEATAPASIAITKVLLLDSASGATVDTLVASTPRVWNGASYETWNEKVTPGGDLRASYQLTAPKWSAIDGSGSRTRGTSSYSIPYKLRITLLIDGSEVTIDSAELQREPQVVT